MFSVYIAISHYKLLKKSRSITKNEILNPIKPIISSCGGFVSEYSPFYCHFPSKYHYSQSLLFNFLKECYNNLISNHSLVGFSIIVDSYEPKSEFDFREQYENLVLKTTDINCVWITNEAKKLLCIDIELEKINKLNKIKLSFLDRDFTIEDFDNIVISDTIQSSLDNNSSKVCYSNCVLNSVINSNILYWTKKKNIEKYLFLELSNCPDYLISILDYFISLSAIFDPVKDLSQDEISMWGHHLLFFTKIKNKNYNFFTLDNSEEYLLDLLNLWLISFSRRFSYSFLLSIDSSNPEFEKLLEKIEANDRGKIFVLNRELPDSMTNLDLIPNDDNFNSINITEYLGNKSDTSLMILYHVLLGRGIVAYSDIILLYKTLPYNNIEVIEEIDNYRREGILIGSNKIYPGYSELLNTITTLKRNLIDSWREDYICSFIKNGFNKNYFYKYIFALITLNTKFHDQGIRELFYFVQISLDLDRHIFLSLEIIDNSFDDQEIKKILDYKRVRECRLLYRVGSNESLDYVKKDYTLDSPLELYRLMNLWSLNSEESIVNDCKKLYFSFQNSGEVYSESRIKTLFALELLRIGNISEAIDYFELNLGYSKSIFDIFSWVRNSAFLSMSLFVKGDFSGSLRVSSALLKQDWILFKSRWYLYSLFIKIRSLNELGRDSEAIELLNEGLSLCEYYNYHDISQVYNNWKGKLLFNCNKISESRETLQKSADCSEKMLFLAEVEYYSNNIDLALDYVNRASNLIIDNTVFDENILWRDGYFILEDFYDRLDRKTVLEIDIEYFSRFLIIKNGEILQVHSFYQDISERYFLKTGINDFKYLYYLYTSLEDLDVELNKDNVFNRMIKLLHQKAANISEHNQKHYYMNNFFNSRINNILNSKKLF